MVELSVVIPTYNRAGSLKTCLEALSIQTQPVSDFEVVVVVDGSTDETVEMLGGLKTPYKLRVLHQANQGQQVARNHGVRLATGRYCLFLDDDIVAEPQLVSEHLKLHRHQENVVGVGQIMLNIAKENWYTVRYADGWQAHYGQLNQAHRKPDWTDCYGGNLSVPRSEFMAVGGFSEDIPRCDDIELGYRLEQHGLIFVYLPQAIGRQDEDKMTIGLIQAAGAAGADWVTLCERHPSMFSQLLGTLVDTSVREAVLREFLWKIGVSIRFLVWLGGLFVKMPWTNKWYRFLFSYSHWCGVRRTITDRETYQQSLGGVPVLMYHAFGKPGEPASHFVIPVQRFEQQMKWLKWLSYRVLSFQEYLAYRRQNSYPPARSVIITIDDGYSEIAASVVPILRRLGYPATVFLVSDKIGGCNDWDDHGILKDRLLLSWIEIKEIYGQGLQFGSHTRTHANLPKMTTEQAWHEIRDSKKDLEHELQQPIHTFAYPYGEYNEATQTLVEQAGFGVGCSVDEGLNHRATPLTALRRIEIDGTKPLVQFLIALRFGRYF